MDDQPPSPPRQKKLLDQVSDLLRALDHAKRPEETSLQWSRRVIFFHHPRHPREMGVAEVKAFLTHLAVNEKVAASTQNQALSALSFLSRDVRKQDQVAAHLSRFYAKRPQHLPKILAKDEVHRILDAVAPAYQLPIRLLYGAGLLSLECLRLRVTDLDVDREQILVRTIEGQEGRMTILPQSVKPLLQFQLRYARALHEYDLKQGCGTVYLPPVLAQKHQHDNKNWTWQYVFPSSQLSIDPRSGVMQRHH